MIIIAYLKDPLPQRQSVSPVASSQEALSEVPLPRIIGGGSLISPISAKQSTRSYFGSSLRPRPSEDQPRYRTFVSKSSTVPLSLTMKLRAMGCYNSKPIPWQNDRCFALLCSIASSLTLLFENNSTAPTRWSPRSKSWQSSLSPIQVL
jgi:hypothetical protein